jgi:hypothetical protein
MLVSSFRQAGARVGAHIFIDNSNVFCGAQRAAKTKEPAAPRLAVRIQYKTLFELVEHGHDVDTRVLAGSVPPGNENLWNHAEEAGYETTLLQKVAKDDGKLGEQGVDEMLHLKIANALLDFDPPQTLVLVTGDGGASDFGTSFLKQVERALKREWTVYVWSWREQLSPKFSKLTRPNRPVHTPTFDSHYFDLVYLKRGNFPQNGASIFFPGRKPKSLK